jgi:hypothetical protein
MGMSTKLNLAPGYSWAPASTGEKSLPQGLGPVLLLFVDQWVLFFFPFTFRICVHTHSPVISSHVLTDVIRRQQLILLRYKTRTTNIFFPSHVNQMHILQFCAGRQKYSQGILI